VSGKQHKREAKRARDMAREAARRKERQRNLYTVLVVLGIVAVGAAIVAQTITAENRAERAAQETPTPDLQSESDTAAVPPGEPCVPEEAPAPAGDKPTFDAPEQVLDDGENYRAVIETTCGQMVFQLLEDDAPQTVNSFVFLAEQGFYDGTPLFRNSKGIGILQGGSGNGTNNFDLGYELPDEFGRAQAEGGYGPGALALAKTAAPDTGGSQFFLVYDQSSLPPEYTLFGQLVEGLDVLRSIGAIPNVAPDDPSNEEPSTPVVVESITIERVEGEPAGPLAPVATPVPSP